MGIFDVFVAVIWGIVEGITEWLPVSSTGPHDISGRIFEISG